jgi:hypothetical protein
MEFSLEREHKCHNFCIPIPVQYIRSALIGIPSIWIWIVVVIKFRKTKFYFLSYSTCIWQTPDLYPHFRFLISAKMQSEIDTFCDLSSFLERPLQLPAGGPVPGEAHAGELREQPGAGSCRRPPDDRGGGGHPSTHRVTVSRSSSSRGGRAWLLPAAARRTAVLPAAAGRTAVLPAAAGRTAVLPSAVCP